MSIAIDDHLRAMWFVEIPNGDWMAGLTQCPDGSFMLTYRFRRYAGPEVWDSKDEKSWYTAKCATLQPLMDTTRELIRAMKTIGGVGQTYEFLRGDKSTREFLEELSKQPFAHTKQVSKAEFEQMQRDGRV